LHSNYGLENVRGKSPKHLKKLLKHALEEDTEKYAWDLWKQVYPLMHLGLVEFVSFEDYKNRVVNNTHLYTHKTSEEIIDEFEPIVEKYMQERR
jgi:hypothetical protein